MHCSIAVQYLIHGFGNQSRGIQFAPDIFRSEPFLDTDMRTANSSPPTASEKVGDEGTLATWRRGGPVHTRFTVNRTVLNPTVTSRRLSPIQDDNRNRQNKPYHYYYLTADALARHWITSVWQFLEARLTFVTLTYPPFTVLSLKDRLCKDAHASTLHVGSPCHRAADGPGTHALWRAAKTGGSCFYAAADTFPKQFRHIGIASVAVVREFQKVLETRCRIKAAVPTHSGSAARAFCTK